MYFRSKLPNRIYRKNSKAAEKRALGEFSAYSVEYLYKADRKFRRQLRQLAQIAQTICPWADSAIHEDFLAKAAEYFAIMEPQFMSKPNFGFDALDELVRSVVVLPYSDDQLVDVNTQDVQNITQIWVIQKTSGAIFYLANPMLLNKGKVKILSDDDFSYGFRDIKTAKARLASPTCSAHTSDIDSTEQDITLMDEGAQYGVYIRQDLMILLCHCVNFSMNDWSKHLDYERVKETYWHLFDPLVQVQLSKVRCAVDKFTSTLDQDNLKLMANWDVHPHNVYAYNMLAGYGNETKGRAVIEILERQPDFIRYALLPHLTVKDETYSNRLRELLQNASGMNDASLRAHLLSKLETGMSILGVKEREEIVERCERSIRAIVDPDQYEDNPRFLVEMSQATWMPEACHLFIQDSLAKIHLRRLQAFAEKRSRPIVRI